MKRRVGSTDLSRLLEQCCHRPGQCYLPDKEFRSRLTFVIVQKCTTSLGPSNVFLSRCSCMSPCRWDYIFTNDCKFVVSVWRVVSEDSDPGLDRPFLLIDCTGWVVTRTPFQRVGTTGYSVIPAYGQILL